MNAWVLLYRKQLKDVQYEDVSAAGRMRNLSGRSVGWESMR